MTFKMKYPIKEQHIPKPSRRRTGTKSLKIRFIVAHDTGNVGSTAEANVNWMINTAHSVPNAEVSSAHIFIDDKEILESIPLDEKAFHVRYNIIKDNEMFGANANDAAIGVEFCYGGKINNEESYKRYVWFLAYLCYKFNLNPLKHIVGHYLLDPTRKTDPKYGLKALGKTFKDLVDDVTKEYAACQITEVKTAAIKPPSKELATPTSPIHPKEPNGVPKEEETELANYQPQSNEVLNATARVLSRFEKKEQALSPQWREKLLEGTLSESEAIGLLFVAIDRGYVEGIPENVLPEKEV